MNQPPTELIGRSLITGETLASEFRDKIVEESSIVMKTRVSASIVRSLRLAALGVLPIFAESYMGSDVAAWLAAYEHNASKLPEWLKSHLRRHGSGFGGPPPIDIAGLSDRLPQQIRFPKIEKAAASLMKRRILTRPDFDLLTAKAKDKAFTMAGQQLESTIERTRDILGDLIAKGPSLEKFEKQFKDKIGTSPIGAGHTENVYRTNIQAAYRDGRESLMRNPFVADVFPYQEYLPIGDARTRDTHSQLGVLGLDGTGIYRRDDPFWDKFTPPWHYQCRCGVNLLTLDAAAKKGVKEAQEWIRTGVKPRLPSWRYAAIPFAHNEGWGQRGGALTV